MLQRLLPLAAFAALLVGPFGAESAPPVTEKQVAVVTLSSSEAIEDAIETETPVTVAAPSDAPPVAAPQPSVCPASYFCYPSVGISGPIVPYDDCRGSTDVGTAIRSLTCVRSSTYLAAHAYTQFGRIAGWRAGDVVFALGTRYVIVDAYTQPGCVVATRAYAPLSLQTSLTATQCGPVLIVQGRPG